MIYNAQPTEHRWYKLTTNENNESDQTERHLSWCDVVKMPLTEFLAVNDSVMIASHRRTLQWSVVCRVYSPGSASSLLCISGPCESDRDHIKPVCALSALPPR